MSKIDEIINQLKDSLEIFIKDILKVNINQNGKFSCLLGTHTDNTPSMAIMPQNKQLAKCFSCGKAVNIFHLANKIFYLPLNGEEFFLKTIPELCKKLNIEYKTEELTEEQKYKIQLNKAYEDAAFLINNSQSTLLDKYLKERNIRNDVASYMQIGTVKSFQDYYEKMLLQGYSAEFLKNADLANPKIFNHNNLIFTINNQNGFPIAFVARNMEYEKAIKAGDNEALKYYNSKQSPIYNKGNILYNFDKALANNPPLYICEGYIDAISGIQNGITNLVALGSASFTDNAHTSHIRLLKKYAIKDVILIPDMDETGIISLEKTIEIFSKYHEFNVKILLLPNHGIKMDLDTYFQNNTIEDFNNLPKLSIFEYMLSKYDDGKNYNADGAEICKEMIPFIVNEKSKIDHYQMIQKLSAKCGIPIDVIQKEVDRHFNEQDYLKIQKIKDFKKDINYLLDRTTNEEEISEIITNKLVEFNSKKEIEENDAELNKQRILSLKNDLFNRVNNSFILDEFKEFGKAFDGLPKGASCYAIPAISHIGKSTFARHLSYDIIKNNQDSICLMITIDDSFEKCVTTFVTLESGLKISEVAKPNLLITKNKPFYEEKMKALKEGWDRFSIYANRIIIKDSSDKLNSVLNIRKLIEYYKNKYHNKDLFVVIDNFHNLNDFSNLSTTERMAEISRLVKEMTVIYDIPIFNVMELKKGDDYKEKRNHDDIKSAGDIVYDVDAIMMFHQDLFVNPDESLDFWYDNENGRDYKGNLIRMPINIVSISKNKIGAFKGNQYYRFRTDRARFYNISPQEYYSIRKSNEEGSEGTSYCDNIGIDNSLKF